VILASASGTVKGGSGFKDCILSIGAPLPTLLEEIVVEVVGVAEVVGMVFGIGVSLLLGRACTSVVVTTGSSDSVAISSSAGLFVCCVCAVAAAVVRPELSQVVRSVAVAFATGLLVYKLFREAQTERGSVCACGTAADMCFRGESDDSVFASVTVLVGWCMVCTWKVVRRDCL
jgi:hypothetical protein